MMNYKMVDKMVLDSRAYKALKECGCYENKLFVVQTYTMTNTHIPSLDLMDVSFGQRLQSVLTCGAGILAPGTVSTQASNFRRTF